MPDICRCEVIKNEKLGGFAFAITAHAPDISQNARAGQFVNIKCGHSRLLRRPISICAADGDTLTFVFEVRGDGTHWLSRRKPGSRLDILGPLGNGFALPESDLIVVGGGVGAAPVLFAAKSAEHASAAILGFRDKSRIILKDDFNQHCDEVYITTDDGSVGIHGMVTKPLEEFFSRGVSKTVLACGPRPMLRAVSELCARYCVKCQVSLEERMACGVGACLVCACKTTQNGQEQMSRVCKDGPVFDSEVVSW